ncbi:MAG: hypothetical protein JWQ89_3503 [Devosia sp.]|uniref:hypothetical protein n=1 Tax=Devosia sp. TaxID=1871048 RepID=UPI00262B353E|nr:hypothetical protein [Devosia sp.]MDB5541776.1 hypothetical protein [Devosia sp.]
MKTAIIAAAIGLALASPALADDKGREVEAVMRQYLTLWNAGDAATITKQIYRFDNPANPMQSEAGLAANFADLKKQGYDKSTMASINGCLLTDTSALAEMRFTRWKTDGTPLGPKDRVSLYVLRKFPDGWRVTSMVGMDVSARLNCASKG